MFIYIFLSRERHRPRLVLPLQQFSCVVVVVIFRRHQIKTEPPIVPRPLSPDRERCVDKIKHLSFIWDCCMLSCVVEYNASMPLAAVGLSSFLDAVAPNSMQLVGFVV